MQSSNVGCQTAPTPMTNDLKFSTFNGDCAANPQLHWSIVGALKYLAITRHEISFNVNKRPIGYEVTTFCDVDWASDPDDRCSTLRYFIFSSSNLVA
uniref:Uncharacterized protein n=1 Tax=Cannabis sativa TaxID=3483 RepID=A0A803P6Y9_CANSA